MNDPTPENVPECDSRTRISGLGIPNAHPVLALDIPDDLCGPQVLVLKPRSAVAAIDRRRTSPAVRDGERLQLADGRQL